MEAKDFDLMIIDEVMFWSFLTLGISLNSGDDKIFGARDKDVAREGQCQECK